MSPLTKYGEEALEKVRDQYWADEFAVCRLCRGRCCKSQFATLILNRGEETLFDPSMIMDDGHRQWIHLPCPHVTEDGACSIYPDRPANCRLWPFENTSVSGCMLVAFRQPFGSMRIGV